MFDEKFNDEEAPVVRFARGRGGGNNFYATIGAVVVVQVPVGVVVLAEISPTFSVWAAPPWPISWILTSTSSINQQCPRQRAAPRFLQTGDEDVTEDDDFYEEDGRKASNEEKMLKSFLQTKTADTARIVSTQAAPTNLLINVFGDLFVENPKTK